MNNRSVPTATLLPHVVYRDVAEACDWLTRVFRFTEHYRHGNPVSGVQMYLGDAYIMLTSPRDGTRQSPAMLITRTQNEKARRSGRSCTRLAMEKGSTASSTSMVTSGYLLSMLTT
jgi:uncharacterized glyoxalase superfamily protein PhnB